MTGKVFPVWKIPCADEIDTGGFPDIGIFPTGELMGVCETEEGAEDFIEDLEQNSPSEQFGETMDDAPYQFTISHRIVKTSSDSVGDNWSGDLVAVDFDGTLTQGEAKFWEGDIEEPREEVVEWTRQQYYDGKHVVVWTARPWSQASTIAARLTEWEVPYHGIRAEKGGADLYVDDKAVSPLQVVE